MPTLPASARASASSTPGVVAESWSSASAPSASSSETWLQVMLQAAKSRECGSAPKCEVLLFKTSLSVPFG